MWVVGPPPSRSRHHEEEDWKLWLPLWTFYSVYTECKFRLNIQSEASVRNCSCWNTLLTNLIGLPLRVATLQHGEPITPSGSHLAELMDIIVVTLAWKRKVLSIVWNMSGNVNLQNLKQTHKLSGRSKRSWHQFIPYDKDINQENNDNDSMAVDTWINSVVFKIIFDSVNPVHAVTIFTKLASEHLSGNVSCLFSLKWDLAYQQEKSRDSKCVTGNRNAGGLETINWTFSFPSDCWSDRDRRQTDQMFQQSHDDRFQRTAQKLSKLFGWEVKRLQEPQPRLKRSILTASQTHWRSLWR